jgi:TonB family protein
MKNREQVCRGLVALVLPFAFSFFLIPDFAWANGVRSINFNEFSYRVGLPFCGEFGPTVRVRQGKFADEKNKFEISQVLYGSLTGSGQEEAVVVASCGPQVPAHPGFENNLVYVYGMENGQPSLLATFAFGQPWNFMGATTKAQRQDRLILFDVIGVTVGAGSISFERMAGEARCCPTFRVTQTFRWSHQGFVLASERKTPWEEAQTSGSTANGVQMLEEGGGDFAERYPWYTEAVKRAIRQNWMRNTIDPSVRADHNAKTTVTFTINRDGSVRNVRISQSSGNRSMDDSAQRALLSIAHFPPLPKDYNGSYVSVTFDFSMGTR